jgi:hypothetical protein
MIQGVECWQKTFILGRMWEGVPFRVSAVAGPMKISSLSIYAPQKKACILVETIH